VDLSHKGTSLLVDNEGQFAPLQHNNIDCPQERTLCSHVIFSFSISLYQSIGLHSFQDPFKVKSSKELICWCWAKGAFFCKWYDSLYCIPHDCYSTQQWSTEMQNNRIM